MGLCHTAAFGDLHAVHPKPPHTQLLLAPATNSAPQSVLSLFKIPGITPSLGPLTRELLKLSALAVPKPLPVPLFN